MLLIYTPTMYIISKQFLPVTCLLFTTLLVSQCNQWVIPKTQRIVPFRCGVLLSSNCGLSGEMWKIVLIYLWSAPFIHLSLFSGDTGILNTVVFTGDMLLPNSYFSCPYKFRKCSADKGVHCIFFWQHDGTVLHVICTVVNHNGAEV